MQTVFTAQRFWNGTHFQERPAIVVEDGKVAAITSQDAFTTPAGVARIDLPEATLAPSFFDIHIHGAAGHDVMEGSAEALASIGHLLASRGTASYLATTVTAPISATLRALDQLASQIEAQGPEDCAWPLGIHLEGPFLSHAKRGVHPPANLEAPSIELFDRFFDAAHGHVQLMTMAPELEGAAELTAHATRRGVRISIGHSNATTADTRRVIAAGATSATHTFNAMRPLDHREPGILGVVLTEENLYAEIICDGIHTAPEMVKLWWKAKGVDRALLITDGMSATGMPDGEYTLGGFPVQVAHGRAMANGVLAGSVLTQDRALTNFLHFTGAKLEDGLQLLTRNPAAITGVKTGTLQVGSPANLVALDDSGKLLASFVNGVQAKA